MNKLFILIVLCLLFCNFTTAQSLRAELEKVKEIKLLESNRDDVRKLFAGYKLEPISSEYFNHTDTFKTIDAEIEFSYSKGKCSDEDSDGYDIEEWKVDSIYISLENPIQLKDARIILSNIGIKFSKYRKEKVYNNVENLYMYHNKELGMGLEVNKNELQNIIFISNKKYYSLICDKEAAKRLISTNSFFTLPLKRRFIISDVNTVPIVYNLILSLPEITATCNVLNSSENKNCSDGVKFIAVFAWAKDDEGDTLTYNYTFTGGKIIGTGAKVLWDLSDVKPGTYTITAAVDDGCGFCGRTVTKTVTVKQCADCKPN